MADIVKNADFSKGPLPTIVQEAGSGRVLSLFYSSPKSLRKTLETRYLWRYSRKQKKVVKKGYSSGNTMKIMAVSVDCDGDALLVQVELDGNACHLDKVSCFDEAFEGKKMDEGSLRSIFSTIESRRKQPSGSYTSRLLKTHSGPYWKFAEEADELLEAYSGKRKREIIWEAADVIYSLMLLLARRRIKFESVLVELETRRRK